MSSFEALVLGVVQGLTEFLPISSSGHLRIVPALAGWDDPGAAFTAVIQLGTMAAVLVYFRADLWRIATAWVHELRVPFARRSTDANLGWFIILGTIPIAIFGFALPEPDRIRRPQPLSDRHDADRLLVRDARRRAVRLPQA